MMADAPRDKKHYTDKYNENGLRLSTVQLVSEINNNEDQNSVVQRKALG